jgi:diguanylate cyclase (GGDEF)-like protein
MGQSLFLPHPVTFSPPARPSWPNGPLGVIACVFLTLIAMEVWQLWRVYDANIQQAEVTTSTTARSIAEQAEMTLKTADTIIASLVERVEAEGTGPEARMRLYGLMTSLAAALPAIHEMGITDDKGNAIVKSLVLNPVGLNYGERAYFQFHATHPDRAPFIGARIQSKIDGAYAITVSRRINNADGSFAGVVVISVSTSYFQHLFDQMQAKSGGVIALLSDDDTILARSPLEQTEAAGRTGLGPIRQRLGMDAPAGILTYTSLADGVPRLGSYQHLSHFPLVALVSQSEWDLQRSWRAELRWHSIILSCVMIVVVVLGRHAIKANRVLNALALQDSLTGLANRRSFGIAIEREFRRAKRSGEPLSLIMIDIDHFKDYNDCYGHPFGDECLRSVARTIQGCLRRGSDLAARYGGEEIAVLLPGTEAPRAYAMAETMRLAVRGLALQHTRSVHGVVTFSAGVATLLPGRGTEGWPALVRDADAALYAAKAKGRDAVETCVPPPIPIASARARLSVAR